MIISVSLSNREWTGLLQHDLSAPEASRCLMSSCINKMEHFHPSCRWTGSFRPSYPAQGILLKQRHFQGADLDTTSKEINHDRTLSCTNTHSMTLSLSDFRNRFQHNYFTTHHPLIMSKHLFILKILTIAKSLYLTCQQCDRSCWFTGLSNKTDSYPVCRDTDRQKHNSLWLAAIKALIQHQT